MAARPAKSARPPVCLLYTSFEAVTATFTCAGKEFTAKGKTILTPGWKEIDRRFRASFKTDADEDVPELARELPEITEGQTFDKVEASVTEHFTTPPKPYTEDTLLSAMERAGAEDMPEDAERQGLGTPATRASILEKLSLIHICPGCWADGPGPVRTVTTDTT